MGLMGQLFGREDWDIDVGEKLGLKETYEPISIDSLSTPIDTSMYDEEVGKVPEYVEQSLRPARKKAIEQLAFTGMRYSPAKANTLMPIETKGSELASKLYSDIASRKSNYLSTRATQRENLQSQVDLYNEQQRKATEASNKAFDNQIKSLALSGLLTAATGGIGGLLGLKMPSILGGKTMTSGSALQGLFNTTLGYPSSTQQAIFNLMTGSLGNSGGSNSMWGSNLSSIYPDISGLNYSNMFGGSDMSSLAGY